ncbi:MAG: cell wall hydrolase [Rickettsiales bacterium]|jgi:hypothetical protein|nr:cell wall hydrolase [Rickettsiales bacterium]
MKDKIANALYSATRGSSLRDVESVAAVIQNRAMKYDKNYDEVIADFPNLPAEIDTRRFEMCKRVAVRLCTGRIADTVRGAVRFHDINDAPEWSWGRGWVAETDSLVFYL